MPKHTNIRATPAQQGAGGKALRLASISGCRQLLGKVLRGVYDDFEQATEPQDRIAAARALIHGTQVLAGLIVESVLEERLAALEAKSKAGTTDLAEVPK